MATKYCRGGIPPMRGLKTLLAEYGIDEKDDISTWKEQIEDENMEGYSAKEFRSCMVLLSEYEVETGSDFEEDYELFKKYTEDRDAFKSILDFFKYACSECEYADSLEDFTDLVNRLTDRFSTFDKDAFISFREIVISLNNTYEMDFNTDFHTLIEYLEDILNEASDLSIEDIRDIDKKALLIYLFIRTSEIENFTLNDAYVLDERTTQYDQDKTKDSQLTTDEKLFILSVLSSLTDSGYPSNIATKPSITPSDLIQSIIKKLGGATES